MTDERPTLEEMFDQLTEDPPDEMDFEVYRSPEKAIDRVGRSFSKEAMEFLHDQVWAYIGAVINHQVQKGPQPVKVKVTVKVDIDTELSEYQR